VDTKLVELVKAQILETRDALDAMSNDSSIHERLVRAARACEASFTSGGKILLAGNGGSAADAQHIAAEFVNYFNFKRPGLPAIALTTDTSVLTSISNDSDYVEVFARQVQALGRPGDVFIAYSTSGKSKNVIAAISRAKESGLTVIGFTGRDPQDMMHGCDFLFQTPSNSTPKIQEGHLVMGHILSGLVEEMLFEKPAG
jgi:D-sedoheptulose 7-phosphate isomerase